jgi:LCP family protein required for cell wall assembly
MKNSILNFFRNANVMRLLSTSVATVLAATYVVAVYAAFTSNIIPGVYLGVLFLVSFLATIAMFYFLVMARVPNKVRVGLLIVAIISIAINIYVYSVGTATNSFISSTQQAGQTTEEYSIVALKSKNIQLSTANQPTGILTTEPAIDTVKTEASKLTKASFSNYENPTEMLNALDNNSLQMVVLKSSFMRVLQQENNNELFLRLQVLATFNVSVPTSQSTVNGDVSKPFAVLISGIDTYGDISTTSRSDVNILAVVNPRTHNILLVNTPRDYYVQLHDTTGVKDKLTHAGLYGVDMSVKTLEDLYGVDINYNVRINFSSLEKMVDTLDGVDVNSAYSFSAGGFNFNEGVNHLNGKQALAFSRERHSFEGGDRTRGENQMRVITAIISKISSPATILKYQQILGTLNGTFQTNMSTNDITSLIRNQIDTLSKWNVTSTNVDGTGTKASTYSMGNQQLYVMIPDQTSVNSAKNAINRTLGL